MAKTRTEVPDVISLRGDRMDPELYPEPVRPEFHGDPNEPWREPVAKLAKKMSSRFDILLGMRELTRDDYEYWGLCMVCKTDEHAEIALKMGTRKPYTLSQMVELTGIPEKRMRELLDEMSMNCLLEFDYENPQHERQWTLPIFVPGPAEFTNMKRGFLESTPRAAVFFENHVRLAIAPIAPYVTPEGAGLAMHVLPVQKSIPNNREEVTVEHLKYWLDKYEGRYAASPCSCRRANRVWDEGCGDDPESWCILLGDIAEFAVETDKGARMITRDEALEIFNQAEENGFVHEVTNVDGKERAIALCNCNVNVCFALKSAELFNQPNMVRSSYTARVETHACVACGKCVEVCPAGAVKLGQKLIKKDGSYVTYPKMPLPTEYKWGPEFYSPKYRDLNRINCYDTGTSPCKTACPAHIAIQGYIQKAKEGKYDEALALIKQDNPLPAVCGNICNRRCEDACTRGTIDEPVSIDEIKKFVAMRDLDAETRYVPKKRIMSVDKEFFAHTKIAIIGAGPAGLSCAYYLALQGYHPTVFEKAERPGGMLMYGIPTFKLEKNVLEAEVEVIKELGVEFKYGVEVGKDVTLDELREQGYEAFYMAIGCQTGRKPGVEGEDAEGAYSAVEFLREAIGKEAHEMSGGNVVVIGGGNVAIDAARVAARCGNGAVSIFSLEQRNEMPALPEEIAEAEGENITVTNGWGPKEVLTENGKVKGVVLKKCLSVFNAEGRFSPTYDENDTMTVECTEVIFSVGQCSDWGGLPKLTSTNRLTYQTEQPDVFIGGDAQTGPKFAIDAIAAGREGAISIHRFVQPHTSLTVGRNRRDYIELDKDDIKIYDYDHTARQKPFVKEGDMTFRNPAEALTPEQIKAETGRCLKCGASVVDENRCIGCGLCTTRCNFDAIHLYRDHPECADIVPFESMPLKMGPNFFKVNAQVKYNELKRKRAAKNQ